ncbi:MAG: hypothetical protein LBE84_04805 [Planctomycetota bacterium]|nr:hypothetical protein [Planctomycetota bacterium]
MRQRGKINCAIGFLPVVLAAAAGCGREKDSPHRWESAPGVPASGNITLYRDVGFDDIPIPGAYELLASESHSFQGFLSRSGVFSYQGRVELRDALEFFRTELPQAGWHQIANERGTDFRILRFRKGGEQLIATLRAVRNGSRAELQLDNVDRNDLLLKGKLPKNRPKS